MMANAKVTALPAGTALAATDLLYVVVNPGTTPVSKKATIANVLAASGTIAYTTITASGLITAGNLSTGGTAYVGGTLTAVGNITNTAGTIATTAVTASGLVTAGNLSTAGTVGAASLTTSGNATFTGGTITFGTQVWTYGTNHPTTGTWYVGNLCFNSQPAAGTVTGWACIGYGTTGGVWLGFGTL